MLAHSDSAGPGPSPSPWRPRRPSPAAATARSGWVVGRCRVGGSSPPRLWTPRRRTAACPSGAETASNPTNTYRHVRRSPCPATSPATRRPPTPAPPRSRRTGASPKSASRARSCSASRKFDGLTSPCTTPWACAKSSASATPAMICTARSGGIRPARSSVSASPPDTYCIANQCFPDPSDRGQAPPRYWDGQGPRSRAVRNRRPSTRHLVSPVPREVNRAHPTGAEHRLDRVSADASGVGVHGGWSRRIVK